MNARTAYCSPTDPCVHFVWRKNISFSHAQGPRRRANFASSWYVGAGERLPLRPCSPCACCGQATLGSMAQQWRRTVRCHMRHSSSHHFLIPPRVACVAALRWLRVSMLLTCVCRTRWRLQKECTKLGGVARKAPSQSQAGNTCTFE